jgi:hypothetical protein
MTNKTRTKTFNEYEDKLKSDNPIFDTDKVFKSAESQLDEIDEYYHRKNVKRLRDRNIRNMGDIGIRELLAKLGMYLADNPKAVKRG